MLKSIKYFPNVQLLKPSNFKILFEEVLELTIQLDFL